MEVEVFVRAAVALLGFIVTSDPPGRISLARPEDEDFAAKYGADMAVLRLAASRLSATSADVEAWIQHVLAVIPEGLRQHHPSILVSSPLLSADRFAPPGFDAGTFFLCPSIYHYVGAVREHVREAISGAPGAAEPEVRSAYGELLEDYVKFIAESVGVRVISVDSIDPADEPHADLLLVGAECGLILEIKRSVATGIASRGLTRPSDIVAVLTHLLGAYRQCVATYNRRRWEGDVGKLGQIAAVVLIDEPIGGEGAIFSDLYARQTAVPVPFEVMSIGEFEQALPVLGVSGLVGLIRDKFATGFASVPLGIFASKVAQRPRREIKDARSYLRPVANDLFSLLATFPDLYDAEWPT